AQAVASRRALRAARPYARRTARASVLVEVRTAADRRGLACELFLCGAALAVVRPPERIGGAAQRVELGRDRREAVSLDVASLIDHGVVATDVVVARARVDAAHPDARTDERERDEHGT